MENAHSAPRFDWIAWLATIPGVPSDWGCSAASSRSASPLDDLPDDAATEFPLAA